MIKQLFEIVWFCERIHEKNDEDTKRLEISYISLKMFVEQKTYIDFFEKNNVRMVGFLRRGIVPSVSKTVKGK